MFVLKISSLSIIPLTFLIGTVAGTTLQAVCNYPSFLKLSGEMVTIFFSRSAVKTTVTSTGFDVLHGQVQEHLAPL
jgi:hypothetical protein